MLDGLMLVLPNGLDAFTPETRLLALESAAKHRTNHLLSAQARWDF